MQVFTENSKILFGEGSAGLGVQCKRILFQLETEEDCAAMFALFMYAHNSRLFSSNVHNKITGFLKDFDRINDEVIAKGVTVEDFYK